MIVPILQIDAFTGIPFAGNPAAVCLLDEPAATAADERWMQRVAAEMNLAETAFVVPEGDGLGLRWFTPTVEVDLCGHATLATAHALWETGRADESATLRFATRSGVLTAVRADGMIRLDFPAEPAVPAEPPPGLIEAIGAGRYVGRNRLDHLVVVESEAEVRALTPDLRRLAKVGSRGVMVTARSDGEYDFVSRFFAPAAGIDEDPVTGSAHCCLGPYWAAELGRTELVGYQASARGGVVRVSVAGERVYLDGEAVTVLRGEFIA